MHCGYPILPFKSHIKFHSEVKSCIASGAICKQLSHFSQQLLLLAQLQQDTKGNIMDIFLYSPLVDLVLVIFNFDIFWFSFFHFLYFQSCNFFFFSLVAFFGICVMFPLVVNSLSIIGYTLGGSQCLESISFKL